MSLTKINQFLLAAILAVNLYVIGLPLYQIASFWWLKHIDGRDDKLALTVRALPINTSGLGTKYAQGEHLIIPRIALDQDIKEGQSVYTVNKGVWRWPKGANPGQTGNTVFIGHRFTYAGPSVFAHLDLVKPGDNVTVVWNQRKFSYTVTQTKLVSPSDTSIIQKTDDKRITIYTCAPMWSTKYRLAVIAQEDKT